ncbi:MAG: magnesium/cobalt transporter CorA [Deltaproteobacteria bacterium]|nr:magnesium/cobalt transporter CorA [Deltaproteobacteria bacterium]
MFKKRKPPQGATPGELASVERFPEPKIHVIEYCAEKLSEYDVHDLADLSQPVSNSNVRWIDIQGLGNQEILKQVGHIFNLHPLTLADIVNVPSQAKVEPYDDYLFIILPMIDVAKSPNLSIEQISLILGKGFVLTFQENYGDVLDPIRKRLRENIGAIRKSGSDYLTYALIDAIVDAYYPPLEMLGDCLEDVEDRLFESTQFQLKDVYVVKRELYNFRRALWPLREVLYSLTYHQGTHFKKTLQPFWRDVHDHCFQVLDVIETYRELAAGLTDLYLSVQSNRLNDVMKVLTVISTIFIPLTFLTSVYGMNFQYMPELAWPYSYPILWGILITLGVGMVLAFKRRSWL